MLLEYLVGVEFESNNLHVLTSRSFGETCNVVPFSNIHAATLFACLKDGDGTPWSMRGLPYTPTGADFFLFLLCLCQAKESLVRLPYLCQSCSKGKSVLREAFPVCKSLGEQNEHTQMKHVCTAAIAISQVCLDRQRPCMFYNSLP